MPEPELAIISFTSRRHCSRSWPAQFRKSLRNNKSARMLACAAPHGSLPIRPIVITLGRVRGYTDHRRVLHPGLRREGRGKLEASVRGNDLDQSLDEYQNKKDDLIRSVLTLCPWKHFLYLPAIYSLHVTLNKMMWRWKELFKWWHEILLNAAF